MSISEREQPALESIENELAGADLELAAKLGIFERLTSGEGMPSRERLGRPARTPAAGASAAHRPEPDFSPGSVRVPRTAGPRVAWRLLWLVLAVGLVALALTFGHGAGKGICTVPWAAACRLAHTSVPGRSGVGV
jgi:hypothetical protein